MKRLLEFVVLIAIAVLASMNANTYFSSANAFDPRPLTTIKACGNPCVFGDSPGGLEYQFREAAKEMIKRRQLLKIDGQCISACTLMAVDMRDAGLVCITDNAIFGFHLGSIGFGYFDYTPSYPADIQGWIDTHGGLRRGNDLNVMYTAQARRFFPSCQTKKPKKRKKNVDT